MFCISDWVYDDYGCRTPNNDFGSCMLATDCRSLVNLLKTIVKPVSNEIREQLRKYYCGVEEGNPKVCCPLTPLILKSNPDTINIKTKNSKLIKIIITKWIQGVLKLGNLTAVSRIKNMKRSVYKHGVENVSFLKYRISKVQLNKHILFCKFWTVYGIQGKFGMVVVNGF